MPDDLDAFLQRAAQQRQRRKQAEIVILEPASQSPAAPQTPPRPAPPPVRTPRRSAPPARSVQPVVVIGEPLDHVSGEDISRRVATHLDSREFEQRASQLGERVGLADDDLEAHLAKVFDHNVGSMGAPGQVVQTGQDMAAARMSLDIMATFRDADSLRRAIIMNEILAPPTHRW